MINSTKFLNLVYSGFLAPLLSRELGVLDVQDLVIATDFIALHCIQKWMSSVSQRF